MQIDLDHVLKRDGVFQQGGDAVGRNPFLHVGALDVDAFEDRLHRQPIAHRRNIAGDRAIAERHQDARALADALDLLEIVLAADGALDDGDVDVVRKLLRVDQRPVDDVRPLRDDEDRFVDVEHGHVAAGAAVEPHRGHSRLFHGCVSLFAASCATTVFRFVISSTA